MVWDRDHFAEVQKFEEMNKRSTMTTRKYSKICVCDIVRAEGCKCGSYIFALYLESLEKSDLSRDEDMADVMKTDLRVGQGKHSQTTRKRRVQKDFEVRKTAEKSEYFAELEREESAGRTSGRSERTSEENREERTMAAKAKRAISRIEQKESGRI